MDQLCWQANANMIHDLVKALPSDPQPDGREIMGKPPTGIDHDLPVASTALILTLKRCGCGSNAMRASQIVHDDAGS